jgi:hypothetical protein
MFFGFDEDGYFLLTFYAAAVSGILALLSGRYVVANRRYVIISLIFIAPPALLTIKMIVGASVFSPLEFFGIFVFGHLIYLPGYIIVWVFSLACFYLGLLLGRAEFP